MIAVVWTRLIVRLVPVLRRRKHTVAISVFARRDDEPLQM